MYTYDFPWIVFYKWPSCLFAQGLKPLVFKIHFGTTEQAAEKHLLSSK
jgi:hypothetical protein